MLVSFEIGVGSLVQLYHADTTSSPTFWGIFFSGLMSGDLLLKTAA